MMDTDRPLRVAIVGLGGIAQLHADDVLALGETLAGVVDVRSPAVFEPQPGEADWA